MGAKRAGRRRHIAVLAASDPVGTGARVALGVHLRAFRREERGTRAGNVEAVHQLRVTTRRLRATLELFRPVLPRRHVDTVLAELAKLGHAIGAVRDLDVLAAAVTSRGRRLDDEKREALLPVERDIASERARTHVALAAELDAPRTRRLVERVRMLVESPPRAVALASCGELAPSLVRPLLRAVHRVGRAVGDDASAPVLHRLRIRAKRLRYAIETLDGLGSDATRTMLARLARLQLILGEYHDAVTQRTWLERRAQAFTASPDVVIAMGGLVYLLGRRARRFRRRVPKAWRRLDRPKLTQAVLCELGNGRGERPAA